MSNMRVYDETIEISVIRDGEYQCVQFCAVRDGDILAYTNTTVDGDAHFSDDDSYCGWLFYDTNGNSYFPEDFGGDLKGEQNEQI